MNGTDFQPYQHEEQTPQQDTGWLSAPNVVRTDKTLVVKNFFNVNDSETQQLHGQKFRRTGISTLITGAVYSMAANQFLLGITNLSYAPSIGLPLPSLVGPGKAYIVKDEAGGAATTTITVLSAGEKTIDGAATTTLTTNYQAKSFYSDGANWFTFD